jgi:hypothetical protein
VVGDAGPRDPAADDDDAGRTRRLSVQDGSHRV